MIDQIRGFFDGTEMPDTAWWSVLWPDPAETLKAVGLAQGMRAVDLCAGDGWFTPEIARVAAQVIAIDIDPMLLELAKARLTDAGLNNWTIICRDAYEIGKVVSGPVDFVFLANAFHGVPDKPRLARAVMNVLNAGGSFAVVNWHQQSREETKILGQPRGPKTELRMSPQQTIDAVQSDRLRFARLIELSPYHYGAIFIRS